MSKNVTIQVTQDDISNGKREDNSCCPIALACRRHFNLEHDDQIEVELNDVKIWKDGEPRQVYTHEDKHFIMQFDDGHYVEPQEVVLEFFTEERVNNEL